MDVEVDGSLRIQSRGVDPEESTLTAQTTQTTQMTQTPSLSSKSINPVHQRVLNLVNPAVPESLQSIQ